MHRARSYKYDFLTVYYSQIAFTFMVYPTLIIAYMGQAAYLSMHHENVDVISFYLSVPGTFFFMHLLSFI